MSHTPATRLRLPNSRIRVVGNITIAALALAAALFASTGSASADPHFTQYDRVVNTASMEGRTVELLANDSTGEIGARVDGAVDGDAVWLERSVDGFDTYVGLLGHDYNVVAGMLASNPEAALSDRVGNDIALFRACMHVSSAEIGANVGTHCTVPGRSRTGDVLAAFNGFAHFLNPTSNLLEANSAGGLKWWHTGAATAAIIGSVEATGDTRGLALADTIYEGNKNKVMNNGLGNNFRNEYIDDTGWWVVAWVDAYRATGNVKYLNSAKIAADFMSEWWDRGTNCSGGVQWKLEFVGGVWRGTNYLSAISNALYLQANSALYNETGEAKYLERAQAEWVWYSTSGMRDTDGLIRDGVNGTTCVASGQKFTYNQGVVISGLVELHEATGDESLLNWAQVVANGVISSPTMSRNGIMRDNCENNAFNDSGPNALLCGNDGPVFKGPGIRGLVELNAVLPDKPYTEYLNRQMASARSVGSLQSGVRTGADLYGLRWFNRNSEAASNETVPGNANKIHVGNQVAGAWLANAVAMSLPEEVPEVTLTTAPAEPAESGWFLEDVTATASVDPNADLEISTGTGWHPYTTPRQFNDGRHVVIARVPGTGRIAGTSLRIDSLPPVLNADVVAAERTVNLTAYDASADGNGGNEGDESGLDRIEYRIDDGPWEPYLSPIVVAPTEVGASYRAFDVAGNVSATGSHDFGLVDPDPDPDPVATTITLKAKKKIKVSRRLTVQATVRASTSATPFGKVRIQVVRGKKQVFTRNVKLNANGKVTLKLPKIKKPGSYKIRVNFPGNSEFKPSTIKPAKFKVVR